MSCRRRTLSKHAPRGNYVLIGGAPTDYSALLYRKAQMRVLQLAIDRGDIRIISQQFARDWRADEALRITEDALLRTGRKIEAIVASNDGTAGGAISALEAAGMAGKVLVTGLDAEKIAAQRIVRGVQTMTIYTPIKPLAFGAVDAAIKLARKEPVHAPHRINNGRIDVPSILYDSIVVDGTTSMQRSSRTGTTRGKTCTERAGDFGFWILDFGFEPPIQNPKSKI